MKLLLTLQWMFQCVPTVNGILLPHRRGQHSTHWVLLCIPSKSELDRSKFSCMYYSDITNNEYISKTPYSMSVTATSKLCVELFNFRVSMSCAWCKTCNEIFEYS